MYGHGRHVRVTTPSRLPRTAFGRTKAAQPLWRDWKPAARGVFSVAVRIPPSPLPHVQEAESSLPPGLQGLGHLTWKAWASRTTGQSSRCASSEIRSEAHTLPGWDRSGVGRGSRSRKENSSNGQVLLDAFLPRLCPPLSLSPPSKWPPKVLCSL